MGVWVWVYVCVCVCVCMCVHACVTNEKRLCQMFLLFAAARSPRNRGLRKIERVCVCFREIVYVCMCVCVCVSVCVTNEKRLCLIFLLFVAARSPGNTRLRKRKRVCVF